MRVLMLGWEFPPVISGGLGTACFGLTKAMSERGVDVTFALPRSTPLQKASHVSFLDATPSSFASAGRQTSMRFRLIPSSLSDPYASGITFRRTDPVAGHSLSEQLALGSQQLPQHGN